MNLFEITQKLEEIMPQFIETQTEYATFMYEYENQKARFTIDETTMGLGNQTMRDAEVMRRLEVEGLSEKKLEVGNRFYRLKIEKEFLMELSKNLRVIEMGGEK